MKELRKLVDKKVEEHDGNKRLGYDAAAAYIDNLIVEGKMKTDDFSIKGLYEALCDTPISESAERVAEDLNTSAFPTIVSKVFHRDIISAYDLALGAVGSLVRTAKAMRTDEELVIGFEAGDTEPQIRRQGMAYEETDFGEKNWKIFMADFGRMISLTREVIYEDRTNQVLQRARDIGEAAGQHKQKIIIQTIEGIARDAFEEAAFQGAYYKGTAKTGANLYANTHVSNFDGQVNDNLAASNGLVDYTDLEADWLLFAIMTDEAGNKINIVPKTLLIPNALKATAAKILKSETLLAVGDTDHQNIPIYNPVGEFGTLNMVSSVFLNDTTSWYMGDFAKQLLELMVYPPATASQGANSELAFTNQIVARFRFSYHFGIGHTDYRYIIRNTN